MESRLIQARKGMIFLNGPAVMVFLILVFLISWNTLQAITPLSNSDIEKEIEAQQPAPTCPPLPTPKCPPSPPPPSPYDSKKLAFLAETRPLPHLPALFVHVTALVPPEWKFKFMGSPAAITHMRSNLMIKRLEAGGKLDIVPLPSNYSLSSRESISQMFTDPHLYRDILTPAEHLLVFQPDSIFCANAPKTINDFLRWDWIGAPWSKTAKYGGNGGLILRKVSKILNVLEKDARKHGDGALEDLWLSDRLRKLPDSRLPGAAVSKTFSVESVWDENPLGYHIGWLGVHHPQIWNNETQLKHIMEYCPEVKIILGMKLDNDKPATVQKIDKEQANPIVKKPTEKVKDPVAREKEPDEKENKPAGETEQVQNGKVSVDTDNHLVSETIKLTGDGTSSGENAILAAEDTP